MKLAVANDAGDIIRCCFYTSRRYLQIVQSFGMDYNKSGFLEFCIFMQAGYQGTDEGVR